MGNPCPDYFLDVKLLRDITKLPHTHITSAATTTSLDQEGQITQLALDHGAADYKRP